MSKLKDILVTDSGAFAEIPGHRYRLYNVENNDYQVIRLFLDISKSKDGTTIDEVIRVLLDYMDIQEYLHPSAENLVIKRKLEEILTVIDQ